MKIMGEISKIAGGALKIYSKRGSSLPAVRKVDPIRRGLKQRAKQLPMQFKLCQKGRPDKKGIETQI